MAEMQLLCKECSNALGSKTHTAQSKFIAFKDRGGLFKPTANVVKVCEEAERCFDRMLASTDGSLPQCTGIPAAISSAVLGSLNLNLVFKDIDQHMKDSALDENHVFLLIKIIVTCYCQIRLNHLAKEANQNLTGPKIR
eukprot:gene1025-347_t